MAPPLAQRDIVPVGELLLGYGNRLQEPSSLPEGLRRNSTFTAIRKMRQDPSVYRDMGRSQLELALGRRADGRNLIDDQKSNTFGYEQDKHGAKCPFFSHVRRSNPRFTDAQGNDQTPRILRRGMTYGPKFAGTKDDYERGVMFTAIAANLAEQYEVVQRWVNGGNVTGVFSGHPDLIAGTYPHDSGRQLKYTAANGGVGTVNVPPRPAATLEWGLYGFIPSRSALALLGRSERVPLSPKTPQDQKKPVQPMDQFGAEPLSNDGNAVKARLEDVLRPRKAINDTLSKLTADGGLGRAKDFGVIIAHPEQVSDALSDSARYSVRNYWKRMQRCEATLYLGMDPMSTKPSQKQSRKQPDPYLEDVKPGDYEKESAAANAFIRSIDFATARTAARTAGMGWFKQQEGAFELLSRAANSQPAAGLPMSFDLIALASRVIRNVACDLYGLPVALLSDDVDLEWPAGKAPPAAADAVRCPVDLTSVFAHVFPPRPSLTASLEASLRGPEIKRKIKKWYDSPGRQQSGPLLSQIQSRDPEFVVRTIIGMLSGFAVPTFGSLVGVLQQLVVTDELWRLQRDLQEQDFVERLKSRVYDLMIETPVPAMVSRTPMFERGPIKEGEVVGVHLGFAASVAKDNGEEDAWKFLFGDLPARYAVSSGRTSSKKKATHACPGQDMALGVIVGTIVALLAQPRLKKTMNPMVLSHYPFKEWPAA
jgi:hypothetical protein